jgi:hypothetical protein
MTEKDYCIIIGIKECEIYALTQRTTMLEKELEAVRAQLHKEQARDRDNPV